MENKFGAVYYNFPHAGANKKAQRFMSEWREPHSRGVAFGLPLNQPQGTLRITQPCPLVAVLRISSAQDILSHQPHTTAFLLLACQEEKWQGKTWRSKKGSFMLACFQRFQRQATETW